FFMMLRSPTSSTLFPYTTLFRSVSELNKLAELVELDSLPVWLRQEIESKKEVILSKLQTEGVVVLEGPQGQQVTIRTKQKAAAADRKSTRLNSSHLVISYAVFCL